MKKKIVLFLCLLLFGGAFVSAQNLEILPAQTASGKAYVESKVGEIGKWWGKVWDVYNEALDSNKMWLSEKLASGIMDRDTLLEYLTYLVKFLSQAGIAIWAIFIIYAGYMYATSIFGWKPDNWKTAIKNSIVWVIIIVISYAIMKAVMAAFLT